MKAIQAPTASSDADNPTAHGAMSEFSKIYETYYCRVLSYVRRRYPGEDARDVTAEVFLVAWRRWDDLPELVLPWLLRTAALTLANSKRGDLRNQRVQLRVAALDPNVIQEDMTQEIDSVEAARSLLETLPTQDRELLLLTAWEGLSVSEAASVCGMSPSLARVRLHRLRQRLQKVLSTPGTSPSNSTIERRNDV